MKIALAGNPNSGKTTLFNELTGRAEQVGNWAGVTVEKKEGAVRKNYNKTNNDVMIVDLPGAYSMSPFTNEESITSEFVKKETPDVIINIIDVTNLSRSLFFTTQLLEQGIPVVVALNKCDLITKKAISIDIRKLSNLLKCPVIEIVAKEGVNNGLKSLISCSIDLKGSIQTNVFKGVSSSIATKKVIEESDKKRFEFVKDVVNNVQKMAKEANVINIHDKIDRAVANKWLGIPIFALIMWVVFLISQTYVGPLLAEMLAGWIDELYLVIKGLLGENVSPLLASILLDGIIRGVGAVVGFLPLIMVLFFLLALLEDCGYMARVAVIMDRFFKKVGLSGKSIIPMIIGTGCSIPGIMATRTIKNERQRRTTAMLTPFMPCGAKLPVIALFSTVFFESAAWVGTSMYFLGIAIIIFGAWLIVRITGEKKSRSIFIMELPEYKVPSIKKATISMISKGKGFIVKAGTIILLCNTVIHIMQNFNWKFEAVSVGMQSTSILATISTPFAFLLIPLGFGMWQLAAAAITGFIAKENVVGTLAVVYSITSFIDTEELVLISKGAKVAEIMGLTSVAALSYLVFNLFTPPCFAAIGAMNSEMENKKWLLGGLAFQFSMGYTVSFLTYQIGTIIATKSLGHGFFVGSIVVMSMILFTILLINKVESKKVKITKSSNNYLRNFSKIG